jgi:hypothetical protein
MTDSYLQGLVIGRCKELGDVAAAEFFGVAPGLVRQWVNGSKSPSLASVEKVFVLPEGAPKDASWAGKEVFIACPMYKQTNPGTLFALLAMWERPKMGFRHRYGDAFIVHARNQLANDFTDSGMPWCMWFDDDMIPPFGQAGLFNQLTGANMPERFAGIHTVNQLRSRNKTFIGGLYTGRNPDGRALYSQAIEPTPAGNAENRRAHTAPFDEVKATDWVATGCLLHSREVLLDMQKKFPHLAPQHPSEGWHYFSNHADAVMSQYTEMQAKADAAAFAVHGGDAAKAGEILVDLSQQMKKAGHDIILQNRTQQGEDQLFGRRALASGHQPYVDFSVVCGHLGSNVWGPWNTRA